MKKISDEQVEIRRKNGLLGGRPVGSVEETTAYAKAFKLYVAKLVEENKGALVDAMIKRAIEGDIEAFKALLDRAHGKPAQSVELGGADGQPIVFMPIELINKHALPIIEGNNTTQISGHVNSSTV